MALLVSNVTSGLSPSPSEELCKGGGGSSVGGEDSSRSYSCTTQHRPDCHTHTHARTHSQKESRIGYFFFLVIKSHIKLELFLVAI